ncbi:unnamed protein product [Owenia fusiformis]|uniref:Peptidase S1 domain-containing protein n=1 Tax=Owenia fusiformis TaxID=6347 RepID=A0A8S4Q8C1_OWEFU|nr:unnamed protein product [Owenia fusiformis]
METVMMSCKIQILVVFFILYFCIDSTIGSENGHICRGGQFQLPNTTCSKTGPYCPNTYQCNKKQVCCRIKHVPETCGALMEENSKYVPHKCVGGGSKPCPQGYVCHVGHANVYSMCCLNVTCRDEDEIQHKIGDKPWISPYDKCSKCSCKTHTGTRQIGSTKCKSKKKCKKCLPEKTGQKRKLGPGERFWKSNCDLCECRSNNFIPCAGACERGIKGKPSEYFPMPVDKRGCKWQYRVTQCYGAKGENGSECYDTKVDYMLEINTTCPEIGKPITSSGTIIISGKEVEPKYNLRWMVYIDLLENETLCGGSIISPRHILTAAHCVHRRASVRIAAGEHDRRIEEGVEQERMVNEKDFLIHGNFDPETLNNDIALLRVHPPLEFNKKVQAIKLPKAATLKTGKQQLCKVSGWGRESDTYLSREDILFYTKNSDVLREVPLKQGDCDLTDKDLKRFNNSTMFCTKSGTKDACYGDSGGPFICTIKGSKPRIYEQYGIVSWSSKSSCGVWSGVYTKVTNYLDWITEKMTLDGGWGGFTTTECTVTCGGGVRSKVRICNKPEPLSHGKCPGNMGIINEVSGYIEDRVTESCNTMPC